MAQKNSTIAARFARDGSFAVLVAGHGGELAKLVLDAAGGYSLLSLHKLSWQEASLRIAEGDRYSGFSVFAKSARSREAGAVEAYSRVFRAGRMTTRQLMIDPDGRWNTQLKDHRSDATVVTGTASGAVGSGYVRMSRRGTDQQGREMWSGDAETRDVAAVKVAAQDRSTRATSARCTTARINFVNGGPGTFRTMSYSPDDSSTTTTSTSSWTPIAMGPSFNGSHTTTVNADGSTDTTTWIEADRQQPQFDLGDPRRRRG